MRFTEADESLMARVSNGLASAGFAIERAPGPLDYYRISNPDSGTPRWLVARDLDGTYRLYSGNLECLRSGASLRDALLPGWLTF